MKKNEETHTTTSIWEAAYLFLKNHEMSGKSQGDGRKMVIGFKGDGVKQDAIDFYNNDKNKVSARSFSDAYRTIKDYLFDH